MKVENNFTILNNELKLFPKFKMKMKKQNQIFNKVVKIELQNETNLTSFNLLRLLNKHDKN